MGPREVAEVDLLDDRLTLVGFEGVGQAKHGGGEDGCAADVCGASWRTGGDLGAGGLT